MQDHYTKIDNRFIDEVMKTLKGSELACCMAIFRKTAGWGKKSAAVSVEAISKTTGINRRHTVIDALHSLEQKEIIKSKKSAGKTTVYSFCYQLKQSFETSDEKRTSDGKRTSTENDTGTSDEKRTTSKKGKKIERESERFAFEFLERYLHWITAGRKINNVEAYQARIVDKLESGHKATIRGYQKWETEYKVGEVGSKYYGQTKTITINEAEITGTVEGLKVSGEKFVLSIRGEPKEGEYSGTVTEITFQTLEQLESILEGKK